MNIFDFWSDRKKRVHFLVNTGIGVMIALLFTQIGDTRIGANLRDSAFDLLVRYENANLADSMGKKSPVFFVDISSEEYFEWGEPLITPRDRLAGMIETAWKKGAPVVVLDILLDREDAFHPQGDQILRQVLEKMLRENSRTNVIFPVHIGWDGKLRPHLLEDLLKRTTRDGRRIFHRAIPNVLASEGDRLNRFWDLYRIAYDRQGHPQVIWGLPFLASVLRDGALKQLDAVKKHLLTSVHRSDNDEEEHAHAFQLMLSGGEVEIPAPLIQKKSEWGVVTWEAKESPVLPYTQRIRFLISPTTLQRRSAGNFSVDFSPDSLEGKIVVIGNSSPETGDIQPTPVGAIKGMFLMGNAINTIVSGKMPAHFPAWGHYAIEALIIVIAAWFFLHFASFPAQLLSSLIFVLLFIPISWLIYEQWGLFFNFIIPLAGMQLHKVAADVEHAIITRGQNKHA